MTRSIHRHEIPADRQWHNQELTGAVLHVATRTPYTVEIWARASDEGLRCTHSYRVFGTGEPLPDDCQYVGTAITPGGQFVWHLMMKHQPLPAAPDA